MKRRFNALQEDIKEMTHNSLDYKYNKAQAFSKSNPEIMNRLKDITPKYKTCFDDIEECKTLNEQVEKFVTSGRTKKAMKAMSELEPKTQDTSERIRIVTKSLDHILEKETEVRDFANALKEKFRNVKTVYQSNRSNFYQSSTYFDSRMQEIEDEFTGFEEWMYVSEFEKAQEEGNKMSKEIDELSNQIAIYPGLYEKAKAILPQAMTEVQENEQDLLEDGIDVTYLNVDTKLREEKEALDEAVVKLDAGNVEQAQPEIETIVDHVVELQDKMGKEKAAYQEIHTGYNDDVALNEKTNDDLKEIKTLYAGIKDRFGLEDWTTRFTLADQQVEELKDSQDLIQNKIENEKLPSVDIIHYYREYSNDVHEFHNQVQDMKARLVGATSDEARAKKQLVKLQLILNEVRLNAATHQLPNVSSQFDKDIKQGEKLIQRVQVVLSHSPLDVQSLNADLQDAIDFVYRLYNNATNLIGVAVMVENAIVFGNRFRSSYPSMDSELTHAELCFQNGEYTRALKMAIQAIENVHPGVYEKLVARKDPSIMNQV